MKTADEMFKTLGYKKIIDNDEKIEYAEEMGPTHIIIGKEREFITATMYGKTVGLSFYEVLTCAQLIKEMGVENKAEIY